MLLYCSIYLLHAYFSKISHIQATGHQFIPNRSKYFQCKFTLRKKYDIENLSELNLKAWKYTEKNPIPGSNPFTHPPVTAIIKNFFKKSLLFLWANSVNQKASQGLIIVRVSEQKGSTLKNTLFMRSGPWQVGSNGAKVAGMIFYPQ